jgi:hypothetical protein
MQKGGKGWSFLVSLFMQPGREEEMSEQGGQYKRREGSSLEKKQVNRKRLLEAPWKDDLGKHTREPELTREPGQDKYVFFLPLVNFGVSLPFLSLLFSFCPKKPTKDVLTRVPFFLFFLAVFSECFKGSHGQERKKNDRKDEVIRVIERGSLS